MTPASAACSDLTEFNPHGARPARPTTWCNPRGTVQPTRYRRAGRTKSEAELYRNIPKYSLFLIQGECSVLEGCACPSVIHASLRARALLGGALWWLEAGLVDDGLGGPEPIGRWRAGGRSAVGPWHPSSRAAVFLVPRLPRSNKVRSCCQYDPTKPTKLSTDCYLEPILNPPDPPRPLLRPTFQQPSPQPLTLSSTSLLRFTPALSQRTQSRWPKSLPPRTPCGSSVSRSSSSVRPKFHLRNWPVPGPPIDSPTPPPASEGEIMNDALRETMLA